MPLTDAAKAEIAAAIRIVREDRIEQIVRDSHAKYAPKEKEEDEVEVDEIIVKEPKSTDPVTPPPAKETPVSKEEPPKRKSAYWGEILE